MKDPKKILSSYGEPPREFYLYPGCEYIYDGHNCIYLEPLENTRVEANQALIQLKDTNTLHTVPLSSLYPILLSVNLLNQYKLSVDNEDKIWDFKDLKVPYKVIDKGGYYVYTNTELEETKNAPIPVNYLSDLQAVRLSYELKEGRK